MSSMYVHRNWIEWYDTYGHFQKKGNRSEIRYNRYLKQEVYSSSENQPCIPILIRIKSTDRTSVKTED